MNFTKPINFYYCGYQKCPAGHYFGPAIRSHYLIHFVVSGKGIFRTGKKIYHVEKNQAFLINPKEITYYEADDMDPWEYVWFGFDGEEAEILLKQYGLDKTQCIIDPDDKEKLAYYLSLSFNCLKNPEVNHTELTGWFYLLCSCIKNVNSECKEHKSYVQFTMDYIDNHFAEDISIEDISEKLNIDRTHLYKLCKKVINMSPKELLTQKRLAKCKGSVIIYKK